MNWCKTHWDQLRASVEAKGLTKFVPTNGQEAAKRFTGEPTKENFDPLMGSWAAINAYMLQSPGLNGRILVCPCCILESDGQPELVSRWIDGATTDAFDHAISLGLIDRQ